MHTHTENESLENDIPRKWNLKSSRRSYTFDKIDSEDTKGHFILIKSTIHQEDVTSVNICTKHQHTQLYETNTTGHKSTY
jgi:hypothetical protein